MAIRYCSRQANLIGYLLYSCFFKYLFLPKNPFYFFTSQYLPSKIFILPWMLYFLLSLYWKHSWKQCLTVSLWFQHATFQDVNCFLVSNVNESDSVSNTESTQFDLKHFCFFEEFHQFSQNESFSFCFEYYIFSAIQTLEALLEEIFNCQSLVLTCYVSECCLLVIS